MVHHFKVVFLLFIYFWLYYSFSKKIAIFIYTFVLLYFCTFVLLYFCTFVLLYFCTSGSALRRPFFAGMPGQVHQVRQVRAHEHGQALPALREEPWPRRPYPGCKSVQAPRRNEGCFYLFIYYNIYFVYQYNYTSTIPWYNDSET